MSDLLELLSPIDVEARALEFGAATPFPFICIDDFLTPEFAREVAGVYPSYAEALGMGRSFSAVNEDLKVQICDPEMFPNPVKQLNELLSCEGFIEQVSQITGIEKLLPDPTLLGGGMHVMGAGGRLDVHVDFNFVKDRGVHRRLNILLFLNEDWGSEWGGRLELWDPQVKHCEFSAAPIMNRCILFETNEISYHGVTKLTGPQGSLRKSYAAYYYTREAPSGWTAETHTTVFKARPDEFWRGLALMPAQRALKTIRRLPGRVRRALSGIRDG